MGSLEFCLEVKGEKAVFVEGGLNNLVLRLRSFLVNGLLAWHFQLGILLKGSNFWVVISEIPFFGTGTFGGGPQSWRNYINVLFCDCCWNACRSDSVIGGCSPTWRNPKKNFWQNLCSQATTEATLFVFVPSLAAWRLWGTASIFATQNCCWCT